MTRMILAAAASVLAFGAAPAFAGSTSEQIAACASALAAQGLAPSDSYKTEFVSVSGASLRTVTMRLIPLAGGETLTAECRIKRGEVVAAEVKA